MKSPKLIGDIKPHPEALAQMRERQRPNTIWAACQNHALDSSGLGDLRFLQCGDGCTFTESPERFPDSHMGVGFRYLLVGKVDIESGEIREVNQ